MSHTASSTPPSNINTAYSRNESTSPPFSMATPSTSAQQTLSTFSSTPGAFALQGSHGILPGFGLDSPFQVSSQIA